MTTLFNGMCIYHIALFRVELPNLSQSVKQVNFMSQTGRKVSFDAFGNARSGYSLFNYIKKKGVDSNGQNYTHQKVQVSAAMVLI